MIELMLFLAAAAAAADPLIGEMQRVEARRGAAIKGGDTAALEKLYAPDFRGIGANGARVDRSALFARFKGNIGGDFFAESTILSARMVKGLALVEGRLRLFSGDRTKLLREELYLHVFRRNGDHWEIVEGAAVPAPPPAQ